MRRVRAVAGAAMVAVGLTTVGMAAASTAPAPGTGSAAVSITLPQVAITDPGGSTRSVVLPTLTAKALTDTGLLGSLGLAGGSLLGVALPGWSVDSSAGTQTTSLDLPLSAAGVTADLDLLGYSVSGAGQDAAATLGSLSGDVAAAPLGLHVGLGQHGVAANVDATSSTGAAELTVDGLDLHLGDLLPADVLDALPLSGLVDIVTGLGLPLPAGAADVRSQLQQLVTDLTNVEAASADLLDARNQLAALLLNVPSTATAQQTLTDAQTTLNDDLAKLQTAEQTLGADTAAMQSVQQQVTTLSTAVGSAQQQLATDQATVTSLTGQVNTLTAEIASDPLKAVTLTAQLTALQQQLSAAQAQVTSDQTALTAAQAALAPVQQQLVTATATVATDQSAVDALQQTVTADQAAVTAAQQALDTLVSQISGDQTVADATALVSQLTATVTGLLDTAHNDVTALPDLSQLRTQLLSTLTAAPLLDVGTIGATASSTATDNAGTSSITCTVTGASVLGQAVPVGDCSGLVARFSQIRSALAGALAQLPLATAVVPSLDGLAASSTGGAAAPDDSMTAGSAALTPLHLAVPSATLGALADATVTSLSGLLAPTQQSLAALGLPAATGALSGSLGALSTALADLPSGSGLAGLKTIGIDASLPGLTTSALRYRSLPATGGTPPAAGGGTPPATGGGTPPATGGGTPPATGGTDDGGGTPGRDSHQPTGQPPTRPPSTPAQVTEHAPTLPFTGDNAAVEIAAALLVALVGVHLLVTARRPPRTIS